MQARNMIVGGALAAMLGMGAVQAANVTTAWENIPQGQDQCLNTGVDASRNAGFRTSVSNDRQTVFGWRDEDSIAIRCIADRRLAVIFIYVVDRNDNNALLQTIRDTYRRPGGMGSKG